MTAPLLFTARDGAVVFEGKTVPEYRAVALRQRLVTMALDPAAGMPRATAFWRIAAELRAALAEARKQSRLTDNPPPRAA